VDGLFLEIGLELPIVVCVISHKLLHGPNDKHGRANRSCEGSMQMGSQRPMVQMIAAELQSRMGHCMCVILRHRNVLPFPMSSSWPTAP